jgi:hypothetical protein
VLKGSAGDEMVGGKIGMTRSYGAVRVLHSDREIKWGRCTLSQREPHCTEQRRCRLEVMQFCSCQLGNETCRKPLCALIRTKKR